MSRLPASEESFLTRNLAMTGPTYKFDSHISKKILSRNGGRSSALALASPSPIHLEPSHSMKDPSVIVGLR